MLHVLPPPSSRTRAEIQALLDDIKALPPSREDVARAVVEATGGELAEAVVARIAERVVALAGCGARPLGSR